MLVPVALIEEVQKTILINFSDLDNKDSSRLFKVLLELWVFIYDQQKRDDKCLNLNYFTQIYKGDLDRFSIKIKNKKIGYKALLSALYSVGLIDINDKYSTGSFSKSYRVIIDFIGDHYEEVDLDFEKIFTNYKSKKYWLSKYPEYKNQINNAYKLKVNIKQYHRWLIDNNGNPLKPTMKNGRFHYRNINPERTLEYILESIKINMGILWFKISNEGRFYNSTTNLSYTALPFCTLDRRKIYEIDIVNCQPLLLSKILSNQQYRKDVEEGIFYEKVADKLGKTRNQFKILSYRFIFFNNKKLNSGIIYNVLEELYPGLITELNKLRDEMNISCEMQRIESSIMVDKIGKVKNITCLLRHDAVFVVEEDIELVKTLMISEFKNLGINIKIKK